jgi:ATP-dependent helicase/nuclease subunit B
MLLGMIDRVFLGWDRPFLKVAVDWLLARRDQLPGMLVVVPTAQSGRRLREALAEAQGALLSPKVVTPGSFLKVRDEEAAPDWIEHLAWVEVLEGIDDWSAYDGLFPEAPGGDGGEWAGGLAREMVKLRRTLQENGILFATAARKLAESVEAERWEALGRLEELVERQLQAWQMTSRSRLLAEGLAMPEGVARIVLAGVVEMPPLLERAWLAWGGELSVLIGAPESEAEGFSKVGRPLPCWGERNLPWPNGSVQVAADPRQQAVEALRVVAEAKTDSSEVALGSADEEAGGELARAFTREGWPAFHPAAPQVSQGLVRWFKVWSRWLADPTLSVMADLLSLPETGVLVGGKRAQKAKRLAELRDSWLVMRVEDLRRRVDAGMFRKDWEKESAEELCQAAEALAKWRGSFQNEDFPAVIHRLLGVLGRTGPTTGEVAERLADWVAAASPMMAVVRRGPGFWIELMLSEHPTAVPQPPPGRVIDVQGWLELFHESGSHLVLCGMNEGKVPARSGGEPWLSETGREWLGLIRDADRAARDAFLYQAMLEARRSGGRVDVICGKSAAGGDLLLPSRLLLAGTREELPERVTFLFKEVAPPEAGLRWQKDWLWKPQKVDPPTRLRATSLGDYLACPFRYYMKHVVKMNAPDPVRAEWNPRDFGTVTHEILERWGRDEEARDSCDATEIFRYFSDELERVVEMWFDQRPPLAVRIQVEAMRQRLQWVAAVQALQRAEGWEIIDVERKVDLLLGGATVSMTIDRIDRHAETGRMRVLDYKTGSVEGVEKSHRKKVTGATVLPAHYGMEDPVLYVGEEKGKATNFRWHNLQLPLYAAALAAEGVAVPTPCYFTVGKTSGEVTVHEWVDFEAADLEAAVACAQWVAGRIAQGIFWPPAEKSAHGDFDALAAGRSLVEMFDGTALQSGEVAASDGSA